MWCPCIICVLFRYKVCRRLLPHRPLGGWCRREPRCFVLGTWCSVGPLLGDRVPLFVAGVGNGDHVWWVSCLIGPWWPCVFVVDYDVACRWSRLWSPVFNWSADIGNSRRYRRRVSCDWSASRDWFTGCTCYCLFVYPSAAWAWAILQYNGVFVCFCSTFGYPDFAVVTGRCLGIVSDVEGVCLNEGSYHISHAVINVGVNPVFVFMSHVCFAGPWLVGGISAFFLPLMAKSCVWWLPIWLVGTGGLPPVLCHVSWSGCLIGRRP